MIQALDQQRLLLPVIGQLRKEPVQGLMAQKWSLREQEFIFFRAN